MGSEGSSVVGEFSQPRFFFFICFLIYHLVFWFRLYLCAWFRFYWGFYEILVFVILICYNLGSEEFDCFLFLSFGKMFLSVAVLISSLGICGLWFHFLGFYILYVFDFVFLVSCIIEAPYQLCERSTKNGKTVILQQ